MAKKVKTPIYDMLKPLVTGAILASKLATGPYGFIVKTLLPHILDRVIRPLFVWFRRTIKLNKEKDEGKNEAQEINQATTPDDYLDALNRRGKVPDQDSKTQV